MTEAYKKTYKDVQMNPPPQFCARYSLFINLRERSKEQ